jgi:spermidine/putrescine transport system permease protein
LIEAANDLYASAVRTFLKVTLPLSMPGLVAGTLLFFIPAAGDYINAELLGTPNTYMVGNVIDSAFLVRLDFPQGAALSILLMVAILLLVLIYLRRSDAEELV